MKMIIRFLTLTSVLAIAACSSNVETPANTAHPFSPDYPTGVTTTPTPGATGGGVSADVGGSIQGSMDVNDRAKMSHALDNALGKSSHWVSASSGITYTITPTQKVDVAGYTFCRRFTGSAMKNGNTRTTSGTACVDANSNWQAIH